MVKTLGPGSDISKQIFKMLSTKNLDQFPDIPSLQKLCKSISALEAIICPDWQYRYYSYNNAWSEHEEFCEMRNGQGDQLLILFNPKGTVVNGFHQESKMNTWKSVVTETGDSALQQNIWKGVTDDLPQIFNEFIFGEPVRSIGTTFCFWRKPTDTKWQIGNIEFPEDQLGDGSPDLLELLDGNPESYRDWAEVYYEEEFEERDLDLELVRHIYAAKPLTKELVLQINPDLEDFDQLWSDLRGIGYSFR